MWTIFVQLIKAVFFLQLNQESKKMWSIFVHFCIEHCHVNLIKTITVFLVQSLHALITEQTRKEKKMNFREKIQEINRDAHLLGLDDQALEEAWYHAQMDTMRETDGAYHLWEDGFEIGDADDDEVKSDANRFGVSEEEFFDKLNDLFVHNYEQILFTL